MKSGITPSTLDRAVSALRKVPGVGSAWIDHTQSEVEPNPSLALKISTTGGKWTYTVEIMDKLSKSTLSTAVDHFLSSGQKVYPHALLLVTDYLSYQMTEVLVREGIEFIDTAGNTHLRFPNFYVLIEGRPPLAKVPSLSKAFTHNGLRVVYALLVVPDVQSLTYRDLSAVTGVSLATVSRTISSLAQQNYVTVANSGGVRVLDFLRLLQRWELGYLETLRSRLGPTTWFVGAGEVKDALKLLEEWRNILVGGDEAASLLTDSDTSQDLTVYADPAMHRKLGPHLALIPSDETPFADTPGLYLFETLTPFDLYEEVENEFPVSLANPVLIRAELLARGGEERRKTANRLLHELILPSYESGKV